MPIVGRSPVFTHSAFVLSPFRFCTGPDKQIPINVVLVTGIHDPLHRSEPCENLDHSDEEEVHHGFH